MRGEDRRRTCIYPAKAFENGTDDQRHRSLLLPGRRRQTTQRAMVADTDHAVP